MSIVEGLSSAIVIKAFLTTCLGKLSNCSDVSDMYKHLCGNILQCTPYAKRQSCITGSSFARQRSRIGVDSSPLGSSKYLRELVGGNGSQMNHQMQGG